MEIKCPTCKYYENFYCKKLRHPLENGYAMQFHSKRCGIIKMYLHSKTCQCKHCRLVREDTKNIEVVGRGEKGVITQKWEEDEKENMKDALRKWEWLHRKEIEGLLPNDLIWLFIFIATSLGIIGLLVYFFG